MTDVAALIALARPRHWIKNVFVLMPLPHSMASGATLEPGRLGVGLAAFCLASSAVYAFNDAADAEADRSDPTRADRPVAAGRVTVSGARLYAGLLFAGALGLAWASGRPALLEILGLYLAVNVVYSLWARSVALLDALLLSSGYVLRVLAGCVLIDAVPSSWILLCTTTLALFLAFAKRRSDLARGMDAEQRPSLSGYTLAFLDQAIGITAGMSIMAYALYCMEAPVFLPGTEFATLPFVVLGVFEYLRVIHVRDDGGSPVDLVLGNPVVMLSGLGWVEATVATLDL